MDGISVAASIVGLLGVAAKISLALNDFMTRVKEAPKLARTVLLEVADICACLSQVQSLLLGAGRVNASNQSLLMVEEILVVLSNCVLVFSELEELVEGVKPDQSIKASDVLKWTMKEKAVTALLLRLQSSKTSLSLMISTLTCSSIGDAQSSVGQLTDIVRQLLESNQDISERLGRMEPKNIDDASTIARIAHNSACEEMVEDNQSIVTVRQLKPGPPPQKVYEMKIPKSPSEFESLLESSRPYVRAARRPEPSPSATSSVIQTMGWSCLSGISLAEVSNISIIELALDKERVWNSTYYDTRHRYLSTIAEGSLVQILENWPLPPINEFERENYCRGCGEVFQPFVHYLLSDLFLTRAMIIISISINVHFSVVHLVCPVAVKIRSCLCADGIVDDFWHTLCIRCTSCGVFWDPKRIFYKLGSLTCSYCLPNCFICGSKTSMYPTDTGEKAFCPQCISRGVPCEICGETIWHRLDAGIVKGVACFHHRNFLIQRAPHMIDFFYPANRSSSALPQDRTPVAAEGTKLNKPLPLVPWAEPPRFVPKGESLFDVFSLRTSADHKGIMEVNDRSTSRWYDAGGNGSHEIEQTDSKGDRRSFALDLNTQGLGNEQTMDEDAWSEFATKRHSAKSL